jgi:uncharacterized protein (DUF4415 family)
MPKTERRFHELTDEEEARIQKGIADDPDNPELTDEELARMRPAREVLPPEFFRSLDEMRRDQDKKRQVK